MNLSAAPSILVRPEKPDDRDEIRHINLLSFGRTAEADLVDALRAAEGLALSLVAVIGGRLDDGNEIDGGEVVGYLALTPVVVLTDGGDVPLLSLGSVVVAPDHRQRGVGTLLVEAGLERMREAGHAGIVVMGDPGFFSRFGFIPASRWGLRWDMQTNDEAFMALELTPGFMTGISGMVRAPGRYRRAR